MKMNWLAGTMATLIALNTPSFSQSPAETIEAPAEMATPAMWRVADEDSEYVLLGTFHILPPQLKWRTEALATAYHNAGTVYFEVEADAPEVKSIATNTMMTKGFNKPGVTLADMLSDAETAKLREICAELKLNFANIDTMRPWNAFLTLSVLFIVNQGFEPGAGVDSVLLAESRAKKKDLRFFETMEEQLAFFTTLEPEVEKKLLTLTLRDWDVQQAAFDELFAAWVEGNIEFVDDQMNEAMREQTPEVYQRLIVDRNKAWAEELDAALRNEAGKGFVAVGAAHLVGGETSVPALLAAKGYTVTPYGEWASNDNAANDNKP